MINNKYDNKDRYSKGVKYMATVQKWGNSLAVRIPTQFAKELEIVNGSKIELQLYEGEMIMKPVKAKVTLEELLSKTKGKSNPHLDYGFGKPEGKEIL
jgi:antitoxin MazE